MTKRLQNKNFILTVEGECEKYYFEHLKNLINQDPNRRYNCTFNPKIAVSKYPLKKAKQSGIKSGDFFHIQDIEDANDPFQKKKFESLLESLKEARKLVNYKLGYTNYCFELWVLLHKTFFNVHLAHRKDYLKYINSNFGTNYMYIDEYKNADNFNKILKQITLNDVKFAIQNGKKIRELNVKGNKNVPNQKLIQYKNYEYFRENPDLDIHIVVEKILKSCL